jgi:outer membrane protein assembly factor BamB
MHRRFLYCLLLAPLFLTGSDAGDRKAGQFDWPQWRGPNRNAISLETGLLKEWPKNGPPLVWSSKDVNGKKGIGIGFSSLSVASGRIFTMGDIGKDGLVFALDEKTGDILWQSRISPGQGDGPRCTPTVDGDRVYALSRQGILACLSVTNGEIRWQLNYKKELVGKMMSGWDYSESPLVDGERLICTPGGDDAALVALNKHDGKVIWRAKVPGGGGAGYASVMPAEVGGVKMYITWLRSCLVGVSAEGKLLWRYERNANTTANIPTVIVKGDLVFCSTGYDSGSALLKLVPDGKGGMEAKEQYFLPGNKLQNHHGGMVLVGEHVYGGHGHNNGMPFCLHLGSGKLAWGPKRGPGDGSAAVVYADGMLYYRYQDGNMALIEATPEGFHVKSSFHLPDYVGTPSWPHPVVANGKLYIRGENVMLCYDVKAK